jgi:thiol-disulfide isomerase/thioredoxin
MKKIFLLVLSATLALTIAGCGNGPEGQTSDSSQSPAVSATEAQAYEFELEDVNGKMHKLSDYKGKPVYLEVWGTWCSVCMHSLPNLDAFAGEQHDFTVLSVAAPGAAGELDKEDFVKWFKGSQYKNLVVLLDENQQILGDFGISAFPSELIFDSEGVYIDGFAGLLMEEKIEEIMGQVARGTYVE